MLLRLRLTKTGCLIRNLTLSLLRRSLTIYIDNYFTSVPLFTELQAYNFGAVSITRLYKEFLDELIKIKTQYIIKLEWNTHYTLLAIVVQDVLCLAWQDNNIVLALSNIYIVDRTEDFREKIYRRLAKTSTNRRIVRHIFVDKLTKSLSIPCFINDYCSRAEIR
jgi:Transposase IS4